jgi:hypothetical protein
MVRKLCKEDVIQIRESTLDCKVRAGKDFRMYRLAEALSAACW